MASGRLVTRSRWPRGTISRKMKFSMSALRSAASSMPSTMTQSVRCWKHCNKAAHVAGWSPNLMRMKASTRWTKALPSATYGDRLIRALVVLDAALGDLVAAAPDEVRELLDVDDERVELARGVPRLRGFGSGARDLLRHPGLASARLRHDEDRCHVAG